MWQTGAAQHRRSAGWMCGGGSGLWLEFFDVGQQFFFVRQPCEVETDHLIGSQRRLLAGPQRDQQARDDAQIRLNLNAIGTMANQVPTAQHVLEESKEYFNSPAVFVNQRDHLGGHFEQVGGDQNRIALLGAASAGVSRHFAVRLALNLDQPQ